MRSALSVSLFATIALIRRAHDALALGRWAPLPAPAEVLAYERRHGDQRIAVALNLGTTARTVALPAGRMLVGTLGTREWDGVLRADEGVTMLVGGE